MLAKMGMDLPALVGQSLAAEGQANPLKSLGIDWPTLVAQLINFTLLLILLYLFAYKPILKMLDERSGRIKESLEEADKVRKQASDAQDVLKTQMEQARREGQAILAQAEQIGQKVKEDARKESKQEGDALIARARQEIQRERDDAVEELRKEFASLAIVAAEKVIKERLDEAKHRQLINEVLEKAKTAKG